MKDKVESDTSQKTEILAVYGAWGDFCRRAGQLRLNYPKLNIQFSGNERGEVSIVIVERK